MTTGCGRLIWASSGKILWAALVAACVAGCAIAPTSEKWREKSDALLAQQQSAAAQAMAAPGHKVVFAAFALSSDSTAFQGDAVLARDTLRSVNPRLAVLLLSNQLEYSELTYPFATKANIAAVLSQVARGADKDTLVVLLFTSHGVPGRLQVRAGGGSYEQALSSEELRQYLEPLRSVPVIVILSACYSGSFIPALASDNRIVMTSAARDRSSFGCHPASNGTFFALALLRNFDASMSTSALFTRARQRVAELEKNLKLVPSQPQISIGKSAPGGIPLGELLHP